LTPGHDRRPAEQSEFGGGGEVLAGFGMRDAVDEFARLLVLPATPYRRGALLGDDEAVLEAGRGAGEPG
jgi:hypothetical protein